MILYKNLIELLSFSYLTSLLLASAESSLLLNKLFLLFIITMFQLKHESFSSNSFKDYFGVVQFHVAILMFNLLLYKLFCYLFPQKLAGLVHLVLHASFKLGIFELLLERHICVILECLSCSLCGSFGILSILFLLLYFFGLYHFILNVNNFSLPFLLW